jgi:hypothetical protein
MRRAPLLVALLASSLSAGPAAAGDPVNDELDALFQAAQENFFGRAPQLGAGPVFFECHQDAGSELCNASFPSRNFVFWVSSCDDSFLTCSGLTGRVRLLVEDDVTAPDTIDCTFEGGLHVPFTSLHPGCAWLEGDHQVEGQVLFRVRALPLRDGLLVPPVGMFHVWLTEDHPH